MLLLGIALGRGCCSGRSVGSATWHVTNTLAMEEARLHLYTQKVTCDAVSVTMAATAPRLLRCRAQVFACPRRPVLHATLRGYRPLPGPRSRVGKHVGQAKPRAWWQTSDDRPLNWKVLSVFGAVVATALGARLYSLDSVCRLCVVPRISVYWIACGDRLPLCAGARNARCEGST